MKVLVMNRNQAKDFSFQNNGFTSVMISITNFYSLPNDIHIDKNNVKAVLPLVFDDEEKPHKLAMTQDDAIKIANFVNLHKNNVDCIVVHCEAGQSRSAGVAAAIMKYLNGDDMPIFDDWRYTPNMTCYRYTLEALINEELDEDEIKYKEDKNIEEWRKYHGLE